jgi:hypothetical protein
VNTVIVVSSGNDKIFNAVTSYLSTQGRVLGMASQSLRFYDHIPLL